MSWVKDSARKEDIGEASLPKPLARAYAHGDLGLERPLLEALDNGFGSFEADVRLVNGELLVGHDLKDLNPDRTLEELYLKPLLARARENNGHVYPSWPQDVQLFIDVKMAAEPTYLALQALLEKYKEIVTTFENGVAAMSAVTVVISGERPLELMAQQPRRYAGYDGRLTDLGAPAALVPVISDDWSYHFTWQGKREMPEDERRKLHEIVEIAHASGQRCRFWDTPDNNPAAREAVWKELVAAKVDYITTDHFSALREWLLSNDPQPSVPEVALGRKSGAPGRGDKSHVYEASSEWFFNRRGPFSKHWRLHAEEAVRNKLMDVLPVLKKKPPHL